MATAQVKVVALTVLIVTIFFTPMHWVENNAGYLMKLLITSLPDLSY